MRFNPLIAAALPLSMSMVVPVYAAPLLTGPDAPTANVIVTGSFDGGATSVRWRSTGTDTDLGSTFKNAGTSDLFLGSITVQLLVATPANTIPLVFDFMGFDPLGNTFTPLFRETVTLPGGVPVNWFMTIDLSAHHQVLTAGAFYAFLWGQNVEDTTANEVNRLRLASRASGITPDAFEIRREFEFGSTRPALSVLPNQLNVNRDLYFFVTATPVPEPAVMGLVLAGLPLLTRRR